jgi:RNA polymerase sigma-70 factor, ECF subfamily
MVHDTSLVKAAMRGSTDAVGQLFDRHWPEVWRAAFMVTGRRDLADDAAQDAFVSAIQALSTFDQARPLGPWLTRIAVNRAIDVLRRERGTATLDDRWVDDPGDPIPDVDLVRALTRLERERRAVIVLHYWLGYPLQEIAQILEIPTGTVSSRLSRALAELREFLEATHG